MTSDNETILTDNDSKQSNDEKLIGSISHRFVETIEHLNSQYNYYKIEMAKDEIILLQVYEFKYKFFDKLFKLFIFYCIISS